MRDILLRRGLLVIPGVWFTASMVFIVMRILPGDAATTILGEFASSDAIAAMRVRLGMNVPLWQQYLTFLGDLARGDLGRSIVSNQPVAVILASVLPHTLVLAFTSAIVGVAVGLPLGVLAAARRDSPVDLAVRLVAALMYAVPGFYAAVLLLVVFALWLGWFPMISSAETASPGEYIRHLVLPALSLGLGMAAYIMRVTRSTLIDVLGEDYVRTAHAKGLKDRTVLYRHALRNALIPILTVAALYLGILVGGTVITESVFNRPGIGRVLLVAIQSRDYIVVQSTLVLYAVFVMLINFCVDIGYALLNPKLRT